MPVAAFGRRLAALPAVATQPGLPSPAPRPEAHFVSSGTAGTLLLPLGSRDRVRVGLRDSPRPMVSTGRSRQQRIAAPHSAARIVATFQAASWSMNGTACGQGGGRQGLDGYAELWWRSGARWRDARPRHGEACVLLNKVSGSIPGAASTSSLIAAV